LTCSRVGPKGAENKEAAYKFINFLLRLKIIADVFQNYVIMPSELRFCHVVTRTLDIRIIKAFIPSDEVKKKLFGLKK